MRSRSAGSPPAQSNRRSPVEVSPALLDGPTLADLRQAVKSPYAPDGPSLPHLAFMWIIDLALWIVVMLRDYDLGMYQCTITHFIAVLPMSDMAALFFPRDLMHWVDLFRFTGGLQMLALTGQLVLNGIDGASLWWSLLRIALAGLRCAHAVVGLYSHFDWGTNGRLIATPKALKKIIVTQLFRVHLRRLYAYVVALPGPQGQFNEFFSAFVFAAFAAFVRSTHNTYQQPLAEGPLTSFQAADALNFFIKNFFYERLLSATPNPTKQTGMLKRSVWYFFMGTVLALQWPFFFDMFAKAPIPFAHAAAEFSLFSLAYARWKSSRVRS